MILLPRTMVAKSIPGTKKPKPIGTISFLLDFLEYLLMDLV